MAKSSAHKTGGYRLHSGPARPAPPYSSAPAQAAHGIGVVGGKALVIRAKRELGPLEDPSSSIVN